MADLTTLAAVKAYLTLTTAGADATISSLITAESGVIERYCNRTFNVQAVTNKLVNGSGTSRLFLPRGPIISIESLSIGGTALVASPDGVQSGYLFDPDEGTIVYLIGGDKFPRGLMNITISYHFGYAAVPAAVAQACNEMVGIDLSGRTNLGISSKILANETVVYSDTGLSKSVQAMLAPYIQRVPA